MSTWNKIIQGPCALLPCRENTHNIRRAEGSTGCCPPQRLFYHYCQYWLTYITPFLFASFLGSHWSGSSPLGVQIALVITSSHTTVTIQAWKFLLTPCKHLIGHDALNGHWLRGAHWIQNETGRGWKCFLVETNSLFWSVFRLCLIYLPDFKSLGVCVRTTSVWDRPKCSWTYNRERGRSCVPVLLLTEWRGGHL